MRPILRVDLHVCQTCTTCQARLACKPRALVQFERGDLPAIDASRCRGLPNLRPGLPVRRGPPRRCELAADQLLTATASTTPSHEARFPHKRGLYIS